MALANNSFELQAKADEWIDVTPTEEVLRTELTRLQEAFEKCTTQLDSSRLENDLLRDRGGSLEHEVNDLRSFLERFHVDLETTQKELANSQKSSREELLSLEATLRDTTEKQLRSEDAFKKLTEEFSEANQHHSLEASRQKTEVLRLERELRASKVETKTHKDAAIRFAEDLRTVRENHEATKCALSKTKKDLLSEKGLHSQTKTTLGTIATLAETLKIEKIGQERSLAKEKRSRSAAESQTIVLSKELTNLRVLHDKQIKFLRSELSERNKDLHGSNQSLEILQIELKDAETTLKEFSVQIKSLKKQVGTMKEGKQELLRGQSELVESLKEALTHRAAMREELSSTKKQLETAILEQDTLRNLQQLAPTETELETKLLEQKKAFEDKLRKIHSILGLNFATAFQLEVSSIQKTAIERMPKSFKVSLLTL